MKVPDWAEEDAEVDGVEVDHARLTLTAQHLELVRRRQWLMAPWTALLTTLAFFPLAKGGLRFTTSPEQDWLTAAVTSSVVGCVIGAIWGGRWGRDERVTVYRMLSAENQGRIDKALDSCIQPQNPFVALAAIRHAGHLAERQRLIRRRTGALVALPLLAAALCTNWATAVIWFSLIVLAGIWVWSHRRDGARGRAYLASLGPREPGTAYPDDWAAAPKAEPGTSGTAAGETEAL